MKFVFCIYLFFAVIGSSFGELAFENKLISSTLPPGTEKFAFEFPFKNTGSTPLEITTIKSSCGCTTVAPEKLIYESGEAGMLKGHFTVGTRSGEQNVSIAVTAKNSAGGIEITELILKLTIPQLLESNPSMLLWRVGADPEEKSIELTFAAEYGIELASVKIDSEGFSVRMEDGAIPSKKKIVIHPVSTATKTQGKVEATITINGQKKVKHYFYALVR